MALASLVLLYGCGYRFAGGGSLPAGIRLLYIPTVDNRSAETGLEVTVTNALVAEVNRQLPALAATREAAEGVLSGEIVRVATTTVSRSGERAAVERRVEIRARLRLENATARELRRIDELSADSVYDVIEGDEAATEANRRAALEDAAQVLAERAYRRLTEDF